MANYSELFETDSVQSLKKTIENQDSLLNPQTGFLTIELDKAHRFRLLPKFKGEENFFTLVGNHWITNVKEDGKEFRTTVLNARIHGGKKMDVFEEYIRVVNNKYAKSNLAEDKTKLSKLTSFEEGLSLSTGWVCYALKMDNNTGQVLQFGLLQFTKTVRDKLEKLSIMEGGNETITPEPFTHMVSGRPIVILKTKTEKGKTEYEVTLRPEAFPLQEEHLELLSSSPRLSERYLNSYTAKDYEKAIKGIQYFDKKHNINMFDSSEFQAVLNVLGRDFTQNNNDDHLPFNIEGKSLEEMSKVELVEFITKKKYNIVIFPTMTEENIRTQIRKYEMENNTISDDLKNTLGKY